MKTETLYNIISDIKVSRVKLTRFSTPNNNNIPWTSSEQAQFYNLIVNYGCDLNLIQSFFPSRTRKQIKRKYREICEQKRAALRRQQLRQMRQSRKAFFDEEILEQKLIKWKNKPNSSESSSSSEDN